MLDTQVGESTTAARGKPTEIPLGDSTPAVTLADIISAHEGGWHQVAARSGKLLMLDIDIPSGQLPTGTADEVDELVLGADPGPAWKPPRQWSPCISRLGAARTGSGTEAFGLTLSRRQAGSPPP